MASKLQVTEKKGCIITAVAVITIHCNYTRVSEYYGMAEATGSREGVPHAERER